VTHRAATTILALATLVLLPTAGSAQFTTFVAPPRKATVDTTQSAIVAAQTARTDSATRMSLSDMKAWVDSAAGVTPSGNATGAAADTAAPPALPADSTARDTTTSSTTTFSNGAVAPDTASPLPAFALGGVMLLLLGGALLRLRPKRAHQSRKRR
jgi:hypothetical protein